MKVFQEPPRDERYEKYKSHVYDNSRFGLKSRKSLYEFYEAHKSELSEDSYINLLNNMSPEKTGKSESDAKLWYESADELIYRFQNSVFVGCHDEYEDSVDFVALLKERNLDKNVMWIPAKQYTEIQNIPCKGACQIKNHLRNDCKDQWNYIYSKDSEYLLFQPYGLKGVWLFVKYSFTAR